ncbi:MAG TPA: DUF4159 domain-containing protein [Chloroflexota bacterium]|nr:DUF4159 domain-containing protein [Chloroflexota bacterium]
MASLVSSDGTSFELAEAETLVGRGGRELNDPPKVDVGPLVGGATVSHHHVRIYRRTGQWYLRVEPAARNATVVGDRTVAGGEEAPLVDNIRIQMGELVLTFRAPLDAVLDSPEMTMGDGDGHTMAQASQSTPPSPPPIPTPIVSPPVAEPTVRGLSAPVVATPKRTDNWPARLPGRPATLAALGVTEFKRVNPFRGLMIDEEAWSDAHDYHRLQSRLHLLAAHGWGIVEGLEVVAEPHVPNTLLIRPGVAFDAQGRPMLIGQERRLTMTATEGTTLYVALRWREEMTAPQRFWNDLDEYTRVVERCDALIQEVPPAPPVLELARLTIAGPVRNADDPLNPQPGEIDLRFRERLMLRPRPDLAVAQLVSADAAGKPPRHVLGLRYLLREIGLTTGYRARWAGVVRLGDPLPPASLLYCAGTDKFDVGDGAIGGLREFLQNGGVALFDVCTEGKGSDFVGSVERLAKQLECGLQPVDRSHPMLAARHVFSEPPLSGKQDETTLAEGGGLVLSTVDYGCAWQGGSSEKPLPRETIRAALELGVNAAVYARQRQRPLEVIELEA